MPQAAPWVGVGLQALGMLTSGNARQGASRQQLKTDTLIPSDIKGLRTTLADLFDGDFLNGMDDTIANAVRDSYGFFMDPALQQGMMDGTQATAMAGAIGDARRPVFENNLTNDINTIMSRFGGKNLRIGGSSDLNRAAMTQVANANNAFEADILGLVPQLQNSLNSTLAAYGSLVGQAGAYEQANRFTPIQLATNFATSYPGNPGYNPLLGSSGAASGLNALGQGLSLIPMMSSFLGDSDD